MPEKVGKDYIRKMADLLKSGATMLSITCPKDKVPLFKLKTGEVICPVCGTRFYIVQSEAEHATVTASIALENLERNVVTKINQINELLSTLDASSVSKEMLESLKLWLEILEKIETLRRAHRK